MLILFLVTVAVLVIVFTALAVFSFIAGLFSPGACNPDAHEEHPVDVRQSWPQNVETSANEPSVAVGIVANLVAYGVLMLVFAGLILLFRALGL